MWFIITYISQGCVVHIGALLRLSVASELLWRLWVTVVGKLKKTQPTNSVHIYCVFTDTDRKNSRESISDIIWMVHDTISHFLLVFIMTPLLESIMLGWRWYYGGLHLSVFFHSPMNYYKVEPIHITITCSKELKKYIMCNFLSKSIVRAALAIVAFSMPRGSLYNCPLVRLDGDIDSGQHDWSDGLLLDDTKPLP